MNVLIVGGSSGLGLELADRWKKAGNKVIVTGRTDPKSKNVQFEKFDLHRPDLAKHVKVFVEKLPEIDTFVYSAGFYQEGRVTDLSDDEIETQLDVCGRGQIYFTKYLLAKQEQIETYVTISSVSQWKPRQLEPVYNYSKAGQTHFSNGLAEDGRIKKVLVVSPAGMDTPFWRDKPTQDTSEFLDRRWVADQTFEFLEGDYRFKLAKLERSPARTEIVETR